MKNKSYDIILIKQDKYKQIQNVLDQIKKTIIDYANDEKLNLYTHEGGNTNLVCITCFDRKIKITFKNNFDEGVIKFFIEKYKAKRCHIFFDKVVTVFSDKTGNLKSKQVGFEDKLYDQVQYDIFNYILDYDSK